MSNDDPTIPPNTPRNIGRRIFAWSQVHTVATAAILGFAAGWLLPKLVRLFL